MSKINQIIRSNARRSNIDYGQAEEAWLLMCRFVKSTIESGQGFDDDTYKSVFIKYLGTFYPFRAVLLARRIQEQKKKEENEKQNRENTLQDSIESSEEK